MFSRVWCSRFNEGEVECDCPTQCSNVGRCAYKTQRHLPTPCVLGKCPTPELCNDFSACDARLLREEVMCRYQPDVQCTERCRTFKPDCHTDCDRFGIYKTQIKTVRCPQGLTPVSTACPMPHVCAVEGCRGKRPNTED